MLVVWFFHAHSALTALIHPHPLSPLPPFSFFFLFSSLILSFSLPHALSLLRARSILISLATCYPYSLFVAGDWCDL